MTFFSEKFEGLIIANPRFLIFILTRVSPILLERISQQKAVMAFKNANKQIPAYKSFLLENVCDAATIHNYENFITSVPIMDKQNYVLKYSIADRCINGEFPSSGSIDESAGSSGKAIMWVRSEKEERNIQKLINFILHYSLNALDRNDLIVLNCWSTGPWATGVKFSQLAQKTTVVKSIGTDKENVIETILELGKEFEYLICGYPPFIKEIADYGRSKGIQWLEYKVTIVTGGEGFSEGWRTYIREKMTNGKGKVYSAYGASDIDIGISFETDLTVAIKQLADKDKVFREKVFRSDIMPSYFGQYSPLSYKIENTDNGELLFTNILRDIWSPKIRYNLKDRGLVYTYTQLKQILGSEYAYILQKSTKNLHLPLLVIFGRSDGTISIDGANIYPMDIQDILFKTKYVDNIQSFFIGTQYDDTKSTIFTIAIELKENTSRDTLDVDLMSNDIAGIIKDHLIKVNKDYRESFKNNQKALAPHVTINNYREDIFEQNKSKLKNVYYQKKG
jgi:phenylacetate-CoA ligase